MPILGAPHLRLRVLPAERADEDGVAVSVVDLARGTTLDLRFTELTEFVVAMTFALRQAQLERAQVSDEADPRYPWGRGLASGPPEP